MERPSHFDCFKTERALLKFFGYPIGTDSWAFSLIVKCTISTITSLCLMVSMYGKIIIEIKNLPEVLECLYFGLTQTTYVWKTFNIMLRHKQFALLEGYLKRPIFNIHTSDQDQFIQHATKMVAFFATTYRVMVGLTITFYAIFPYIEHTLPLPGWFPMDTNKYHFFIYVFHLAALILNGYNHTSLDCITASMVALAAAQFEILKNNLENLTNKISDIESAEKERVIVKRLKIYIHHHNVILNFVEEIEEMYSSGIFIQFLCSVLIMCVTGFQVFVMSPNRIQYITLVLYFLCNLNQVAIYCWFGHDILDKSSGVGEACYMSDWNTLGPKANKMLFVIMERSKIPTILTAGKIFNLTLVTLMSILRTSYSYLAVLQQMYK